MEVITQTKTVKVTTNGTIVVTPDPSGIAMDALDQVTVNTNVDDEHTIMTRVITENGVFNAPEGVAYNKVTVDVTPELEAIDIVSNGTYEPEEGKDGWNKIVVDVPSDVNNQDKTVTTNGIVTADLGYSGLGQVTVNVEPTEEQIAEYKAEGAEEQKAKLETLSVDANGVYTKDDGYNRVVVDVPSDPEELAAAKAEGIAEQKAKLEETSVTINKDTTVISKEDGYSEVTINAGSYADSVDQASVNAVMSTLAPTGLEMITENGVKTITLVGSRGKSNSMMRIVNVQPTENEKDVWRREGADAQKAKLVDLEVTENGTYSKEDGYKKVTVNVEGGDIAPDTLYLKPTNVSLARLYYVMNNQSGYDATWEHTI